MMNKMLKFVLVITLSNTVLGCSASQSAKIYSENDARQQLAVTYGTVVSVHDAAVQAKSESGGPISGAVLGASLGYAAGNGLFRPVLMAGGAVVGLVTGPVVERYLKRRSAFEIEVRYDDGNTVVIVQENDVRFQQGERVRILTDKGGTLHVRQL